MVACAKFLGRVVDTCTRGVDLCVCAQEEKRTGCKNGECIHASDCSIHNGESAAPCDCEAGIGKMRELLRVIAYPRRGTNEENMDIYAASEMIQKVFSSSDLQQE